MYNPMDVFGGSNTGSGMSSEADQSSYMTYQGGLQGKSYPAGMQDGRLQSNMQGYGMSGYGMSGMTASPMALGPGSMGMASGQLALGQSQMLNPMGLNANLSSNLLQQQLLTQQQSLHDQQLQQSLFNPGASQFASQAYWSSGGGQSSSGPSSRQTQQPSTTPKPYVRKPKDIDEAMTARWLSQAVKTNLFKSFIIDGKAFGESITECVKDVEVQKVIKAAGKKKLYNALFQHAKPPTDDESKAKLAFIELSSDQKAELKEAMEKTSDFTEAVQSLGLAEETAALFLRKGAQFLTERLQGAFGDPAQPTAGAKRGADGEEKRAAEPAEPRPAKAEPPAPKAKCPSAQEAFAALSEEQKLEFKQDVQVMGYKEAVDKLPAIIGQLNIDSILRMGRRQAQQMLQQWCGESVVMHIKPNAGETKIKELTEDQLKRLAALIKKYPYPAAIAILAKDDDACGVLKNFQKSVVEAIERCTGRAINLEPVTVLQDRLVEEAMAGLRAGDGAGLERIRRNVATLHWPLVVKEEQAPDVDPELLTALYVAGEDKVIKALEKHYDSPVVTVNDMAKLAFFNLSAPEKTMWKQHFAAHPFEEAVVKLKVKKERDRAYVSMVGQQMMKRILDHYFGESVAFHGIPKEEPPKESKKKALPMKALPMKKARTA